jgi:histone chaperone ASF1
MASVVRLRAVCVTDAGNPAPSMAPLEFKVEFDSDAQLPYDLEWKVAYISKPRSRKYDQVLDVVSIGPVACGTNVFALQVDPPVYRLGKSALVLSSSYGGHEFVRVGYYVIYNGMARTISTVPIVTTFPIQWHEQKVDE